MMKVFERVLQNLVRDRLATDQESFVHAAQVRARKSAGPVPPCREDCIEKGQYAAFSIRAGDVNGGKCAFGMPGRIEKAGDILEAKLDAVKLEAVEPVAGCGAQCTAAFIDDGDR